MEYGKDLKKSLTLFEDHLNKSVEQIQQKTSLTEETMGAVVSEGLVSSMSSAVNALEVFANLEIKKVQLKNENIQNEILGIDKSIREKELDLVNKKINTEIQQELNLKSLIKYRDDLKAKEIDLKTTQNDAEKEKINLYKEQKYHQIAQRLRQQGASVDNEGKVSLDTEGKSIAEKNLTLLTNQATKVATENTSIGKRDTLLESQTIHNVVIQNMKQCADYTMGLAGGGLVPDQKMHTNFFIQSKALLYHMGADINEQGLVTIKDPNKENTTIQLGTFEVGASAAESTK